MRKPTGTIPRGLPTDPILALRANELLAAGRQLEQQGKIADAARISAELVNVAPDLPEAHQFMGVIAMRTGASDIAAALGLAKATIAVENTRGGIGKAAMKLNAATPVIEVDPETYEVRADGELLTCEPAEVLPMAQRYFMF